MIIEIIQRCGPAVFNIKDAHRSAKSLQALFMHGFDKLDKYSSIGLSRKQHFELRMFSYYPQIYGKKDVLERQPYSPDLAPMIFFCFPKIKAVYTGGN
jgi:hypothetical protein